RPSTPEPSNISDDGSGIGGTGTASETNPLPPDAAMCPAKYESVVWVPLVSVSNSASVRTLPVIESVTVKLNVHPALIVLPLMLQSPPLDPPFFPVSNTYLNLPKPPSSLAPGPLRLGLCTSPESLVKLRVPGPLKLNPKLSKT